MYVVRINSFNPPRYFGRTLNTTVGDEMHARKFSLRADAECFLMPLTEIAKNVWQSEIVECQHEDFAHVTPKNI